jgi:hypothetical protein
MRLLNILKESINKKLMLNSLKDMGFNNEDAQFELESLVSYVEHLPNPVKLYRIVVIDDKNDINTTYPGSHYSTNQKDLVHSHSYLTGYGNKYFLMVVSADKKLIDVNSTIHNNILYPNENEVTLKNRGKGVEILTIKKVKF